ncbi:MAG TPA: serine hydrolase [Patescibacteria group bacterium]|jgi:beta-lactamase class A|nr:serine hydrolase [Patescibacteria group bacterium]
MGNKKIQYLVIPLVLVAGFFIGRFWQNKKLDDLENGISSIRENNPQYKYINSLLAIETPAGNYKDLKELETKVQDKADEAKSNQMVDSISVYYRGSQTRWFEINPDEKYIPASLMKVPVMIAYYKQAEKNPEILDEKLTYDGKEDLNKLENVRSTQSIQKGQTYTVEQLIEYMIKYSDNNAAALLTLRLDSNFFKGVLSDLGMPLSYPEEESLVTAKMYALSFRILYNGSYLSNDYSEKALKLLTETDFKYGIDLGIEGVSVANKFGEAWMLGDDGTVTYELHDCGLVYAKKRFFLCIMTKGKNFNNLKTTIEDLSRLIYDQTQK